MVRIELTTVTGWEASIRGMRNPLNSWDKADSYWKLKEGIDTATSPNDFEFILGENDLKLAKTLVKAGSSDRKFLRMLHVSMDITLPLYVWKEADQYKISTTTNSCSTMHKIHSRDLTMEDFSTEHLSDESLAIIDSTIKAINDARDKYMHTEKSGRKEYWWQMIELLPSSFNQKRTWDLDYETLLGMYFSRRHHKLDEWHEICRMIEELPYMKEFISVLEEK